MALTLARVGDAFEVFHAEQFGDGYHKDVGADVARCPDGTYALVGDTVGAVPGGACATGACTTGTGAQDMFIVKYSAANEVLWTVQRGTPEGHHSGITKARGVACDPRVRSLSLHACSVRALPLAHSLRRGRG